MIWIALRMLTGDTTKWIGVLLGLFLSTFLITHLLGMFNGMMARTYALITDVPQAQVWVMDPSVEYVEEPVGLPSTALQRVRGVEGVAWATPLLYGSLRARLPGGASRSVLIVGVDDSTFVGAPTGTGGGDRLTFERLQKLRQLDAVMLDTISARTLMRLPDLTVHGDATTGPLTRPTRPLHEGDEFYVNDRRLVVVDLVELGPRFLNRPVMYTTYSRAEQVTPPQRNLLSFVLVRCQPGVDPPALARRIEQGTGLRARSAKEFCDDTYWYYVRTTGVVDRIAFMVGIGIVVGMTVSGLLLYLFTVENTRYYAVLNAMGAVRSTISLMVGVQALVCGAMGYGLGVGASCLVGMIMPASSMPYTLVWWALAGGAVVTLLICVVSAVLSVRRLFRTEPASAFER